MKKIEEEYASHVVPKEIIKQIENPYDLVLNIEYAVKLYEKEERRILRRRRKNHAAQSVFIGMRDILKAKDQCYEEMLKLLDDYINMSISITEVLDDETFEELRKLMDYLVNKYEENRNYYNSKLDGIDYATRGITYFDGRQNYTHPAVKEFIENKINGLKSAKKLEKK